MTTKIVKTPLLRAIAMRTYATSQTVPAGGTSVYDIETTTLPNKLVVVSGENNSTITRVSVIVRAGSRNETPDNLGAAHVLRIAAGLSTRNSSQFAIIRNIQEVGASLTATSDRELISYTLEGTRSAIEDTLPFLKDVVTEQVFKPWEVSDNVPRLRLELARRPPQLRAVDLLHKAAYRRGLGNSLFIAKYQLGKISTETLQHYVASNFVASNAAVAGVGIDHQQLVEYAQSLSFGTKETKIGPAEYKGGEIRSDKGGDFAYVAIGTNGAGFDKEKEALAFAVLQRALGTGPSIKWSNTDSGLLSKAVGSSVGDAFALNSFNYSYSDAGLFGVLAAAPAANAGKLVETAVKVLKSGSVPDENVTRGKNQLKTALLLAAESGGSAIEVIGTQAVFTGNAIPVTELAAAVDKITAADVNAAAKKSPLANYRSLLMEIYEPYPS